MNVIVLPPFYDGTSFQEISSAFKKAAKGVDLPVKFIQRAPLKNTLTHNSLDDDRYVRGQADLLRKLVTIRPGDDEDLKILFMDAFNPGLDLIRYYHEQQSVNAKYAALVHGGTYLADDLYDFPWLINFENAWFKTYDHLYVSSHYSKTKLSPEFQDKARVFPWGMDAFKPVAPYVKDIDVIFPHRLDRDKGADLLIEVAKALPGIGFTISIPSISATENNPYYSEAVQLPNVCFAIGEDNASHYKTLSRAKVVFSNSKQELYGYSVMKSVLSDCLPVLPNDQCYPDYFSKDYIYGDKSAACDMIVDFVAHHAAETKKSAFMALKKEIRGHSFKNVLTDFFL